MNLTVEAIYEEGVLKPIQPLSLPEGAHVSLVIETTTDANQLEQSPAEILAAIAAMPLESTDQNFSNRAHDQALYTAGEEP